MEAPNVEFKHPTDHGWAWVIVFAAGVANFIVNGGVRTMGLMVIEIIAFYKSTKKAAMIVTAFVAAGFSVFACVGNILGVRFTMRKVAVVGAILTFAGMLLTVLAPSVAVVVLTLGMISGMGYGFLFGPSMVLVGQYCPKRLSICNGLAVAGGSIGQLVLPYFITGVMQKYMFKGGLLMYSALLLHGIPAMLLLRPPSFYGIKRKTPPSKQPAKAETKAEEAGLTTASLSKEEEARQGPTWRYSLRDGDIQPHTTPGHHLPPPGTSPIFDYMSDNPEFVRRASVSMPHSRSEVAEELHLPEEEVTVKMTAKMFFLKCCDPVLMKNAVFIIYMLGLSFGHSGFIAGCTFIAPYTQVMFRSKEAAALVILIMGFGDLVGRCGGGLVAQRGWFSKTSFVGGAFVASGVLAIGVPFFGPSIKALGIFGFMYGLLGGTYMAQLVAMVDELFGSALLASSLGISTMVMGLVAIPILIVLGGVADKVGYALSVRMSGFIMLLGGGLFYTISILAWLKMRKIKRAMAVKVEVETQTSISGDRAYDPERSHAGLEGGPPVNAVSEGRSPIPLPQSNRQLSTPQLDPRMYQPPPSTISYPPNQSQVYPLDDSRPSDRDRGDKGRWSGQDFRWSKIPNSSESNL